MFGRRIALFTAFGFSIGIDMSWFLIATLVAWSLASGLFPYLYENLTPATYWAMGIAGSLGLFASVVLHELGHAVVARRFGVEMRGITLFIFGGVAEMGDEPPSAKAEFWVAVAGPAVSIALAGNFWLITLAPWGPAIGGVIGYLAMINLILVLFNLVPAFPLDGGRVLRAALWQYYKSLTRATRIAASVGSAFGVVLMVMAVFQLFTGNFIGAMWWFLIGLFLRHAAASGYQHVLIRQALQGEPVERFMSRDTHTVPPGTPVDRFVDDYVFRHHYKMFPVVDDGHLRGCVNIADVKQLPREEWPLHTVDEIAAPCSQENTVDPHTDAVDALRKMQTSGRSRLLVADHGDLVGIIALKDLMRFLALKLELENGDGGKLALPDDGA